MEGPRNHFWRYQIDGINKDLITVHNRFTYSSTIEIEGFKVVDFCQSNGSMIYLLNNQTTNFLYIPSLTTKKVPIPANTQESSLSLIACTDTKVIIFSYIDDNTHTFNFTTIANEEIKYGARRNYVPETTAARSRGAALANGGLVLGFLDQTAGVLHYWSEIGNMDLSANLYNQTATNVSIFSVGAVGNRFAVVVHYENEGRVEIMTADVVKDKTVNRSDINLKLLKTQKEVTSIECQGVAHMKTIYCTLAAFHIVTISISEETGEAELIRTNIGYKNMRVSSLAISTDGEWFAAYGERPSLNVNPEPYYDSIGIMYYSLKKHESTYVLGGMDYPLLKEGKIGKTSRLLIKDSLNLIIWKPNGRHTIYKIKEPTASGKICVIARLWNQW